MRLGFLREEGLAHEQRYSYIRHAEEVLQVLWHRITRKSLWLHHDAVLIAELLLVSRMVLSAGHALLAETSHSMGGCKAGIGHPIAQYP